MSKLWGYLLICLASMGGFVGAMHWRDGETSRGLYDIAIAAFLIAYGASVVERSR